MGIPSKLLAKTFPNTNAPLATVLRLESIQEGGGVNPTVALQTSITSNGVEGEFSSIPVSPRGYFNHSVRLIA